MIKPGTPVVVQCCDPDVKRREVSGLVSPPGAVTAVSHLPDEDQQLGSTVDSRRHRVESAFLPCGPDLH
jgi:hypothetical protein